QDSFGLPPSGVNAKPHIARGFVRRHALVESLAGFTPDQSQVATHLTQLLLSSDGPVSRDDRFHVELEYPVCDLYPVADVPLKRHRCHVKEGEVARKNHLLVRQIDECIAECVGRAQMPQLYLVTRLM